jgi:AI-2 transport protein TqsA
VTVTFVALVFWAWLLGPLGAILAIPLTLLSKALLVDIDPKARWADALLRASAKEPDPAELPPVKKPRRRRHDGRAGPVDGPVRPNAEQPVRAAPDEP